MSFALALISELQVTVKVSLVQPPEEVGGECAIIFPASG